MLSVCSKLIKACGFFELFLLRNERGQPEYNITSIATLSACELLVESRRRSARLVDLTVVLDVKRSTVAVFGGKKSASRKSVEPYFRLADLVSDHTPAVVPEEL